MTSVVLLAVLVSVAYGGSDVVGGAVVRRHATGTGPVPQTTELEVLLVLAAVLVPRRHSAP